MHTIHDYELDKAHQAYLEAAVDITSAIMKAFPKGVQRDMDIIIKCCGEFL